jgi:methionyl-tRNA formyltransferase
MRIVFMGTPAFALPSLTILLDNSYSIPYVVTAPDKPRGRGQRVSVTPVKQFALERGLPVLQPDNLKDPTFLSALQAAHPDLMVVVAFRILPQEVFSLPKHGAFNLHASLLPKYRGAAPINWAIINGETETGVTTFLLQERVDTGSILLQARVRIGPDETAGELHDRLAEVGAEVLLQTVRLIERGKAQPRPQDESQASLAPKLFRETCRIPWSKSAKAIHDFVRGLSPSPCAWTMHGDHVLKIYRTALVADGYNASSQPGEVVHVSPDALHVATGNGIVALREVQLEGRKRLPIAEFLRGYSLSIGEVLH